LGIEGNRIKLSRKAILREQRAKMQSQQPRHEGDGAPAGEEAGEGGSHPRAEGRAEGEETVTFEGGGDFSDDDTEPNFNREDANHETVHAGHGRPDRPPRGDRPHGGGGGGGRGGRHRRGRGGRGGSGGGSRGGGGGDRGGNR